MPRRLRDLRTVAGARARPGLVGLPADPGRDHAVARGRRRPGRPSPWPGMLALMVGLIEIALGIGKLGLRRRPPGERGPGRLHERPGRDDHRRSAPEAVRLLDRRRLVLRRARRVRSTTSTRPRSTALIVGLAVLAILLVLPRITPQRARGARRRGRATAVSGGARARGRGSRDGRLPPERLPPAELPWTSLHDVGRCCSPRSGSPSSR